MFVRNRKYFGFFIGAIFSGLLLAWLQSNELNNNFINFLILFALVPLFIAVESWASQTTKNSRSYVKRDKATLMSKSVSAFFLFWIAGITFNAIRYAWCVEVVYRDFHISMPVAFSLFAVFSLINGLYFSFLFFPFVILAGGTQKKSVHSLPIWALAILSTAVEVFAPKVWFWTIGGGSEFSQNLTQLNAFLGPSALTPIVIIGNYLLARALLGINENFIRSCAVVGGYIFFILVLMFGGYLRSGSEQSHIENMKKSSVWVVELFSESKHRLEVYEKKKYYQNNFPELLNDIKSSFQGISSDAKPNLIILPGGVFGADFPLTASNVQLIKETSSSLQTPVLLETLEEIVPVSQASDLEVKYKNSAFLYRSDKSVSEKAYQCKFLPILDGVKFSVITLWLADLLHIKSVSAHDMVSDCTNRSLSYSPDFKVFPVIGADIFDSNKISQFVASSQVGFLANLVDEGLWLGTPLSHLARSEARKRAIELGRTTVFASSLGDSLAFDPIGKSLDSNIVYKQGKSGVVIRKFVLPLSDYENRQDTVYVGFGNFSWIFLAILAVFASIYSIFRKPR